MLTEMMIEECRNSDFVRILTSYHRLSIMGIHGLWEHTAGEKVQICIQGKSLTSDISLQTTDLVKSNTGVIYWKKNIRNKHTFLIPDRYRRIWWMPIPSVS